MNPPSCDRARAAFRRQARAAAGACLILAGCGSVEGYLHSFTDVVETKPSRDGSLVAASVWEERGFGKPHTSGIVIVAKGANPLDGQPILVESEDYRKLEFRWTGPNALEVRLPCGGWSALTNMWRPRGSTRVVAIDYLAPSGCVTGTARSSALPAGPSQPAAIMVSPN